MSLSDFGRSRVTLRRGAGCTIIFNGRMRNMSRTMMSLDSFALRVPRCNAGRSLGISMTVKVILCVLDWALSGKEVSRWSEQVSRDLCQT